MSPNFFEVNVFRHAIFGIAMELYGTIYLNIYALTNPVIVIHSLYVTKPSEMHLLNNNWHTFNPQSVP